MKINFDPQAQTALQLAKDAARQMKNAFIGTEHLLIGIMQMETSGLSQALSRHGLTARQLMEDVMVLFGFSEEQISEAEYTRTMEDILQRCKKEAQHSDQGQITLRMLTCALLETPNNVAVELLRRYEIDAGELAEQLGREDISSLDGIRELRNLNEVMRRRSSPVVERQAQMQAMIRILCRKEKANPLLLGDPGVGKTALVEQLAKDINEQRVPDCLKHCLILELNVNGLVAGTKYRGEFEEKIQKILELLRQFPQAILFIDEIHQIIGAGKAEGSIDVAGVLKPVLARGQLRCIGATTYEEYLRFIEKDRALQRRFQPVMIEEPQLQAARRMLEARVPEYEQHHQICFPLELIGGLMESTQYFMPSRKLPDKALDVLDMACVSARIAGRNQVEQQDIDEVLQQLTEVPVQDRHRGERTVEQLKQELIGQREVIAQVQQQLRWMDLRLVSERPLGIWLLSGQEERQKQQLARILAQTYFGQKDRLIEIDMIDYQDNQAAWRLVYSSDSMYAPWLEKVRRNPYSLLLIRHLDQIRPDCEALIRKALDQGMLEEQPGRLVDLRHCLVLLETTTDPQQTALGFLSDAPVSDHWLSLCDVQLRFRSLKPKELRRLALRRLRQISQNCPSLKLEIGAEQALPFTLPQQDSGAIDHQIRRYLTEQLKKSAG